MDDTREIVTRCFPHVHLRCVKNRIFPGPARNLGAKQAQGTIIAFIDADCEAEPDWVERIVACHNEGHLVVGGAVKVANPGSTVAWAGHLGEFREFLPAGKPRHMVHVPTCNISYRKQLFEACGGFPDSYYPQEDLLFNYMLNQQGIQVWFDPDICIRNNYIEDLWDFLSHQHRIGRVTRATLRRIDLPGAAIARRGGLAWFSSPILGLLKFLRTLYIFARKHPQRAFQQPVILVWLALGSIWWARGFADSARKGLKGIKGWDDPDEPIFSRMVRLSDVTEQK